MRPPVGCPECKDRVLYRRLHKAGTARAHEPARRAGHDDDLGPLCCAHVFLLISTPTQAPWPFGARAGTALRRVAKRSCSFRVVVADHAHADLPRSALRHNLLAKYLSAIQFSKPRTALPNIPPNTPVVTLAVYVSDDRASVVMPFGGNQQGAGRSWERGRRAARRQRDHFRAAPTGTAGAACQDDGASRARQNRRVGEGLGRSPMAWFLPRPVVSTS